MAKEIIEAYYRAFNEKKRADLMNLLSDQIIHDVNQGERQVGLKAFEKFLDKMDFSYDEQIRDLVVMTEPRGLRASAEFMVDGQYLKTDPGLPEARGQRYLIPAGAFFELEPKTQKILRVTTYYNLPHWVQAVSQAAL